MIAPLIDVAELAVACTGFAAIVLLISRSALAGAGVVLGAFLLFEATSPPVGQNLVFQLGGISVYPLDVASLALLSVGVWRLFSEEIFGPAKIALVTLVVLLATHFLWGVVEFGLQPATNNSRSWFPVVSGIVYGATVRSWDRRLPTAVIATGCFLAGWSIAQILRHGLHAANTFIYEGGELVDARPVISMGVLVMLEGLILLLARGRFTLVTAGLAVLLVSGIVLLQYRTLWVAAIACAVLGGFYLAMRYRASNERVVYLLTAVTLILVPVLLFVTSRVGTYQQSAESATGDSSTFAWRIESWKTLIGEHSSPFELLFGTSSGSSREIVVGGITTNLSAHNLYVEALLSYGLIGLFALFALGALALGSRHETTRQLGIASSAVVILIVGQALVSMAHGPNQVQGLLFGSLLSAACLQTELGRARRHVGVRGRELAPSR